MATRFALADLPLRAFLGEALVPYEADEVTRLIVDGHEAGAMAPQAHLTVGELREWLLEETTGPAELSAVAPGLTPEMAGAVSKLMRNQDLILAAKKCRVATGSATPSGSRGSSRCGSSPTTRPTTGAASPPRCSTTCSSGRATRSSV
jgi:ethanolamine ammonia-lyase large subunit